MSAVCALHDVHRGCHPVARPCARNCAAECCWAWVVVVVGVYISLYEMTLCPIHGLSALSMPCSLYHTCRVMFVSFSQCMCVSSCVFSAQYHVRCGAGLRVVSC